jgi:hypothetical protein
MTKSGSGGSALHEIDEGDPTAQRLDRDAHTGFLESSPVQANHKRRVCRYRTTGDTLDVFGPATDHGDGAGVEDDGADAAALAGPREGVACQIAVRHLQNLVTAYTVEAKADGEIVTLSCDGSVLAGVEEPLRLVGGEETCRVLALDLAVGPGNRFERRVRREDARHVPLRELVVAFTPLQPPSEEPQTATSGVVGPLLAVAADRGPLGNVRFREVGRVSDAGSGDEVAEVEAMRSLRVEVRVPAAERVEKLMRPALLPSQREAN